MENPKELIGVLQAISIVAKNLAEKLIRIEKEVEAYETNQLRTVTSKNQNERRQTI